MEYNILSNIEVKLWMKIKRSIKGMINMSKSIPVEVKEDLIESLTKVKKPILAIVELIWNGLDADADKVEVNFTYNPLNGIETIAVLDNGLGIDWETADNAFGNLGGSWKKNKRTTLENRLLHGRRGKGRFRAFSLGNKVEWHTCYKNNGTAKSFCVVGKKTNLKRFEIENDPKACRNNTGTRVLISDIEKNFTSLVDENSHSEIAEYFALYLSLYSHIKIKYNGKLIDGKILIDHTENIYIKGIKLDNGNIIDAALTIIEWKTPREDRKLYLCDGEGFTYDEITPGIHAPGFNFSAYLKSDLIKKLADENQLDLKEIHRDFECLLDVTKNKLREYFRARSSKLAGKLVEEWKKEDIYPYKGKALNIIEKTERQVFDICALNLNEYLPSFEASDNKTKSLSLRLLKHALETSPSSVKIIFEEVLGLSSEKIEEFAHLIENISLEAIISATKLVTERLSFLRGLEMLLFDPELKNKFKERSQLHRIIAEHTWIFGEEFNLTLSEKSLTEVLKKHLSNRGSEIIIDEKVNTEGGKRGIVDLMLSRIIPQPRAEEREHLIVELKRPKVPIDDDIRSQIVKYAMSVSQDERFKDVKTKWSFWVVSNEMTDSIRKQSKQKGRRIGCLHEDSDMDLTIWVKTWGEIINDSKAKLNLFQKTLNFSASNKDAIDYLHSTYRKYLPDEFMEKQ
jgi:hypothetical protein